MSSVKIVRDRNNPSILVPDVYRKFILRCKRKQQLQQYANTENVTGRPKQAETSQQQQSSPGRKNMIDRKSRGSVSFSTTVTTRTAACTNDMIGEASGSTNGLRSSLTSNRKSHTSRRNTSLAKKFQPVLEPLVEVV